MDGLKELPEILVCYNCKLIINTGKKIYVHEMVHSVNLKTLRKCPKCGNDAIITASFIKGVHEAYDILLRASKNELLNLAERIKSGNLIFDEKAESEVIKDLKGVLPKTRNELYALLAVIVAIIGLLVDCYYNNRIPPDRNEVVNILIMKEPIHFKLLDTTFKTPKRNTPCPCGSGQLFKRCHGVDK